MINPVSVENHEVSSDSLIKLLQESGTNAVYKMMSDLLSDNKGMHEIDGVLVREPLIPGVSLLAQIDLSPEYKMSEDRICYLYILSITLIDHKAHRLANSMRAHSLCILKETTKPDISPCDYVDDINTIICALENRKKEE